MKRRNIIENDLVIFLSQIVSEYDQEIPYPLTLPLHNMPINVKIPLTIGQIVYNYMMSLSSNLISRTNISLNWCLHSCGNDTDRRQVYAVWC